MVSKTKGNFNALHLALRAENQQKEKSLVHCKAKTHSAIEDDIN